MGLFMLCTKRSGVFFLLELPDTRIRRFAHRQNKCFLSFLNKQKIFFWKRYKKPHNRNGHGVFFLEVPTRFELVHSGFADRCLTTWLRHRMERITRLELATSTLARWRSTRWAKSAKKENLLSNSLTAVVYIYYHISPSLSTLFYFFCIHFSHGFSRLFLLASQPRFKRITAKGQSSF